MASKGKRKVNLAQLIESAKAFMLYHGEKIAAAVVVIIAVVILLNGFSYTGIAWGPDTIDKEVQAADSAIKASKYSAADAGLVIIDYAKLSESIKEPINAEPYKTETAWNAPLLQPAALREQIAVLAPEIEEVKAVREKLGFQVTVTVKISSEQQRQILENMKNMTRENTGGSTRGSTKGGTDVYDPAKQEVVIDRSEDGGKKWSEYINNPKSGYNSTTTQTMSGGLHNSSKEYSYYAYADIDVTPETNYMYRAKIIVSNPNLGLSPGLVAQGVDTTSKTLSSDWSPMKTVLVPGQTRIEIAAEAKAKPVKWTAPSDPFRLPKITANVCVFDDVSSQDLPPLPMEISRGSVCDIAARDITSMLKRDKAMNPQEREGWEIYIAKNKAGLNSGMCIADIFPEYELSKFDSKEGKTAPDVTVPCKILVVDKSGHLSVQKEDTLKTTEMTSGYGGGGRGYPGGGYDDGGGRRIKKPPR